MNKESNSENYKDNDDDNENNKAGESPFQFVVSIVLLFALVIGFKSSILDANNIPSGSMIPTLKIGDYLFVNKMRYSLRLPFTNYELFRYDDPVRGDIITFIPPRRPGNAGKHYVKRVKGVPGDRIRITSRGICSLIAANDKINSSGRPDYCGTKDEPKIAFVEYRVKDRGPWKNSEMRPMSHAISEKLLIDADDASVLMPEMNPDSQDLSIVMEARINGKIHHLVESSREPVFPLSENPFCETLETQGCIIPPGKYLAMGDNRDNSSDSRVFGYVHRDAILGKAMLIYFSINWHDGICTAYSNNAFARGRGYNLPDFSPRRQAKECSELDRFTEQEGFMGYLRRTFVYRLGRMQVRWRRIFTLLN